MVTKVVEYIFCGLLALAALGHLGGTFFLTQIGSPLFVWALAGDLACALLVAINILSIRRVKDIPLTWISFIGAVCWVGISILFGFSINNILDQRALFHGISAAGIAFFSAKKLLMSV